MQTIDEANCLDQAYEKMRNARTESNYKALIRAFLEDVRKDIAYPAPRTVNELKGELEKNLMLSSVMRTRVGTLEHIYTSRVRIRDKDGTEGVGAEAFLYIKSNGYFPGGHLVEDRDGIILNAYDSYGGVVIPRKDAELVLSHRNDESEFDIDPEEGVRLNLALAYWWLVEKGRYGAPSIATDRVCSDCGLGYRGGVVCPRCGYDLNAQGEISLREVSSWYNRHDAEEEEILQAINCGKKDNSALTDFLDRMKESSRHDPSAAHFLGQRFLKIDENAAYGWLLTAARAGDAAAMVDLGKMVADHARNQDDAYLSIRLYRLALSVGMPMAARNLARRYERGLGLRTNPRKAFDLTRAVFEAGLADGALGLSRMFELGFGCKKDAGRAFEYAARGDVMPGGADSTYQLSRCFRYGIGVAKDPAKSDELLWQSLDAMSESAWIIESEGDDSELQCRIQWAGDDEQKWCRVAKWAMPRLDDAGRIAFMKLGADKGIPFILNDLGVAYGYNQYGLKKDYDESERLLKESAAKGTPNAYYNLGLLYKNEMFSRRDDIYANRMIYKSAQMGHAPAQYYLWLKRDELSNECYADVTPEAWLRKAADQEHVPALKSLAGRMFDSGDGKSGTEIMHRLIEMGDVESALILGLFYRDGDVVERNEKKAFEYISWAANAGLPDAMNELGSMYGQGVGVESDADKAWEWIQKAAKANNPRALCNMADRARSEGRLDDATVLYRKAAEVGYEPALDELVKMRAENA